MKPLFTALGLAVLTAGPLCAEEVTLTPGDGHVDVSIGGKPFTSYVYQGASRPYLYPILAADGTALTRSFPQKDVPGEDHDHPWHRSFWFAHSMVNGVDFWNEGSGDTGRSPKDKGSVVQSALVETRSGPTGIIRTRDNWVAPDGRVICTDERSYGFSGRGSARFIDFSITIHAPADTPLTFGDNKDGTMAMRLAQWMTLPHKYQKKETGGTGHIVDAKGDRDEAAWGKRADWCDYYASHDGKVYGVAIFDCPDNLRHPTWWMARDYGLFGANPFGQHDYEKLPDAHAGDYTVPAGGTLTLRYRFYLHRGDTATARVAQEFARYAHDHS